MCSGCSARPAAATDSTTTIAPTFVSAVNDVRIVSHADFVLKGSGVQAGGSIFVEAQNVQILAMQNLSFHQDITEKWGFFSDSAANNGTASVTFAWQDSKTVNNEWQSISQASSLQAGGNVSINAGSKVSVTGSTVTAAGDVSINAAQVELAAAQDTVTRQKTTTVDSFGILPAMNNGFGFSIGSKKVSDETGQTQISNIGALIGSTGGAVTINAGEALTAQGSIIEALAGNVTLTAGAITLAAGVDSFTTYAIHKERFVGLNVSAEAGGNNPLSGLQKGATYLNAADKTKDPQAKLLYEAAAGVQAAQGLLNAYNATQSHPGAHLLRYQDRHRRLGEHLGIGLDGPAGERRLHPGGGQSGPLCDGWRSDPQGRQRQRLQCDDVRPARRGHAEPRANQYCLCPQFECFGLRWPRRKRQLRCIGLQRELWHKRQRLEFGLGKPDNLGQSRADHGERLELGDAHLRARHEPLRRGGFGRRHRRAGGAQPYHRQRPGYGAANRVAHLMGLQRHGWLRLGVVVSASYAKGDAYGNYASVTTTSGLFAGSSGYAVTVGGTTTLTAAALASSADASKNSLTTGALVTNNLANSMNWKASYWGFSFSASTAGMGGVQPGLSQKTGGNSTGQAQATIAPGTVNILNAGLQKSLTGKTPDQIVAALNRAAAAQNKAADKLPGGLQQTLQNQADRSNALIAASNSTAKLVGDVSDQNSASRPQGCGGSQRPADRRRTSRHSPSSGAKAKTAWRARSCMARRKAC